MSAPVLIHGFDTSNNFKVRVALGYKDIPFEFRRIDPAERADIIRLTGQPMTPIMEHGDVRLFDSAAIVRYLEANFLDTPRLFSEDYPTMREIERWEAFGRTDLSAPLLRLVGMRIAGIVDAEETAVAEREFAAATRTLEQHLTDRDWLVGDSMTAADVTTGPVVFRVLDHGLLPAPSSIERARAWAWKIMEHDPVAGD